MKRDIIAIIACILSLIWIIAIAVQFAIGPDVPEDKYPAPSDPATLPYDARYPGLTLDY